jgi:NADH:ubiquinone oxidoreductase subunit E
MDGIYVSIILEIIGKFEIKVCRGEPCALPQNIFESVTAGGHEVRPYGM